MNNPLILAAENPNLAACIVLIQAFWAGLFPFPESLPLFGVPLTILNLILAVVLGKWLLTGSGFDE